MSNSSSQATATWENTARVTLLLALTLALFVLQHPVLLVGGTALCATYAVVVLRNSKFHPDQLLILLAAVALFLPAFIKPYFGLSPAFYVLSTMSTFLAAVAVTRHAPLVLLRSLRFIFGASVAGIAWALYVYWGMPEPLGEVIEGSSTNGIPAYLIVIQVGVSLCTYLTHGRLPLISPIFTVLVAFFGYGRGSLVVAGLLFAFSAAHRLAQVRNYALWSRLALVFCAVATILCLYLYIDVLIDLLTDYTKLGAGLLDVNRLQIWRDYSGKIDAWTLLTGADYAGTIVETERQGNPHIAFIRTHAFFGLPATVCALASPLVVFLAPNRTWGSKIVFAAFAGMAALRAASEPILFPTLLDLYYFSYLIVFFRYAPRNDLAAGGQASR
ncbi:hypothetical protein [Piscinibacter terrae]|uniref:O-antigen ligase domain-containing protein n=1 Tax=Piscinibacter terrae TaxID=2496871 RepID=A0A3N7HKT2_9BURK|nr:hypothetical protein [Albitalea terrae]RQP21616.1 hypothetical protein DZC73_27300 [Albitalea terrae]